MLKEYTSSRLTTPLHIVTTKNVSGAHQHQHHAATKHSRVSRKSSEDSNFSENVRNAPVKPKRVVTTTVGATTSSCKRTPGSGSNQVATTTGSKGVDVGKRDSKDRGGVSGQNPTQPTN